METRTYYLTKYALTDGIKVTTGRPCASNPTYIDLIDGFWSFLKLGRDIFEDIEDAKANAELRRQKKIASLKKQIAKLEALNFGGSK